MSVGWKILDAQNKSLSIDPDDPLKRLLGEYSSQAETGHLLA